MLELTNRIDSQKGLDEQPTDPTKILKNKVQELKKNRQFEEALLLETVVEDFEKNKKHENYWRDLGLHLRHLGKYEEALECFDKDLEINRINFGTLYEKGVILYEMGRYDESLESLFKAYEIKYSKTHGNSILVDNLKAHKKFEEILVQPNVNEHELKEHYFWYYLAMALYQLKRYDESIENFNRAALIKADDSVTFYDWAKCELMANRPEKCLELLERACRLDPTNRRLLRIDPSLAGIRNSERFRTLCESATTIL